MRSTILTVGAAALVAVGSAGFADAAQPSQNAQAKAAQRAAFMRGDASTKVRPQPQPQTEQEALATKREVMPGVIEMQLPEDRMVELVLVRDADGTTRMVHRPVGSNDTTTHRHAQEAVRE